jgi:hypothetical protein
VIELVLRGEPGRDLARDEQRDRAENDFGHHVAIMRRGEAARREWI